MSSDVRLAPWMPAIRATANASPLGTAPSRNAATHSALSSTRPAAVAVRVVTSLAETSTIRASPAEVRWGNGASLISVDLLQQPDVDVVALGDLRDVLVEDDQGVGPGQVGEQVGAVTSRELDLPAAVLVESDDAAGQLTATGGRGNAVPGPAADGSPLVGGDAHQLADRGPDERFEGDERADRVARQHDHRCPVVADQPEPLRLAR